MKINSSFYDYYDNAVGYDGIDRQLHYNRVTKTMPYSDISSPIPRIFTNSIERQHAYYSNNVYYNLFIVGFCGRLYPAVNVVKNGARDAFNLWFYDSHSLKDREKQGLFSVPTREPYYYRPEHAYLDIHSLLFKKGEAIEPDIFLEVKAPSFVLRNKMRGDLEIVVNPMLRDYAFFQVMNPFNAFQEISMYLGNVLVQRDVPDTIADEHRIAQHGFDEWSFRKKSERSK